MFVLVEVFCARFGNCKVFGFWWGGVFVWFVSRNFYLCKVYVLVLSGRFVGASIAQPSRAAAL